MGEAIPADSTGNEVQVYFGCWLDINQTRASAAGSEQPCFSGDSVYGGAVGPTSHPGRIVSAWWQRSIWTDQRRNGTGATPAVSDKLAQRNLTIVGVASPRQVPLTFDIKPTHASLAAGQAPDELMINWSQLPAGSKARIYLPGTSAETIFDMATRMYARHGL